MAAAMSQPSFAVVPPAAEDTMEISSAAGDVDGDIDIDLESTGAGEAQYAEEDQMIEDAKSDIMIEDTASYVEDDRVMQDGIMQYDGTASASAQQQDEELLDFSDDDEISATTAQQPQQPQQLLQPLQPEPKTEADSATASGAYSPFNIIIDLDAVDSTAESTQQEQDATQAQPEPEPSPRSHSPAQSGSHVHTEEDRTAQVHNDESLTTSRQEDSRYDHGDETQQEPVDTALAAGEEISAQEQPTAQTSEEDGRQSATQQAANPAFPAQASEVIEINWDLNEEEAANASNHDEDEFNTLPQESQDDAPAALSVDAEAANQYAVATTEQSIETHEEVKSPTVTGLHPTVVEYEGNEIYLFPSSDPASAEQYLLENENLATSSLGDLLQACRVALGESITEEQELVLGVEELDLYLSEDSTPAFSVSFYEILNIYVQLHKHDGNDSPSPLRVTLTTQTRFTHRLTLLTQHISEGKGYSQLPFLQEYDYDNQDDANVFPDEDNALLEYDEGDPEQQQQLEDGQDTGATAEPGETTVEHQDKASSHQESTTREHDTEHDTEHADLEQEIDYDDEITYSETQHQDPGQYQPQDTEGEYKDEAAEEYQEAAEPLQNQNEEEVQHQEDTAEHHTGGDEEEATLYEAAEGRDLPVNSHASTDDVSAKPATTPDGEDEINWDDDYVPDLTPTANGENDQVYDIFEDDDWLEGDGADAVGNVAGAKDAVGAQVGEGEQAGQSYDESFDNQQAQEVPGSTAEIGGVEANTTEEVEEGQTSIECGVEQAEVVASDDEKTAAEDGSKEAAQDVKHQGKVPQTQAELDAAEFDRELSEAEDLGQAYAGNEKAVLYDEEDLIGYSDDELDDEPAGKKSSAEAQTSVESTSTKRSFSEHAGTSNNGPETWKKRRVPGPETNTDTSTPGDTDRQEQDNEADVHR